MGWCPSRGLYSQFRHRSEQFGAGPGEGKNVLSLKLADEKADDWR